MVTPSTLVLESHTYFLTSLLLLHLANQLQVSPHYLLAILLFISCFLPIVFSIVALSNLFWQYLGVESPSFLFFFQTENNFLIDNWGHAFINPNNQKPLHSVCVSSLNHFLSLLQREVDHSSAYYSLIRGPRAPPPFFFLVCFYMTFSRMNVV